MSEVTQLCPTLSDPMDCSLPGSSIHGIFQARVLEWGAIAFSHAHTHTHTHTHTHILDCYLVIKKNEIMPFAATRVDLEILTLSEVSQTEKPNVARYNLCGI